MTLPFLDDDLIQWRDGVPLRTAGLTLPVGAEHLYFVGLAGPRGPQLPVYSEQAALVARMIRIAPEQRGELSARFAASEPLDTRIDIVRAIWQRQMRRAHRALDAFDRATDLAGAPR